MINHIKHSATKAREIAALATCVNGGLKHFKKYRVTPHEAYMQMVALYCRTRGISREVLGWNIRRGNPASPATSVSGALGQISAKQIKNIAKEIRSKGYYVFAKTLDAKVCERLMKFSLSEPSEPRPRNDDMPSPCVYDPANPLGVTYHFSEEQLVANEDIQRLMCDPTFLAVAQAYLKTLPVFDLAAMWWTTGFQKEADSASAQLYHFDMDHNKWIKIFIYLTDVTPENGPHCYIEGTHKPLSKPGSLLDRGYARIPDMDLREHYSPDRFKEVCGPVGTIIAGDTSAFHKGKPVVHGHRLVLEFEYGDSLFGANHTKLTVHRPTEELLGAIQRKPACFERIATA
jgi:hypothetical protein